jgi:hypothetical protein
MSVQIHQRGSSWTDFRDISNGGLSRKIVYTLQISLKKDNIQGALQEDLSLYHIARSDIGLCSSTIQGTHCCASLTILSIFITMLTAKRVRQQWKGKKLLRFHGNNAHMNASKYCLPSSKWRNKFHETQSFCRSLFRNTPVVHAEELLAPVQSACRTT